MLGKAEKVFIFIDRAKNELEYENSQVNETAHKYSGDFELKINWVPNHLGVADGVPAAISWALETVDQIVVLEDDCLPNEFALEYFEKQISQLNSEKGTMLVAGTAPNREWTFERSVLSKYPLIWGWATTKEEWISFIEFRTNPISFKSIFYHLLGKPIDLLATCYFLGAEIKIRQGRLKAWDCSLALYMLINNRIAILPNISCISNVGRDQYASHTLQNSEDNIITLSGTVLPNLEIDNSKSSKTRAEKSIEKEIYHFRKIQILSPLKSLLRL
jgi:hypothetical protein